MKRVGYTLAELLVATTMSTIIIGMVLEVSTRLNAGVERVKRNLEFTSATQAAIDLIRTDVELAGQRGQVGSITRVGTTPSQSFCTIAQANIPAEPAVGLVPKPQLLILRSDRFPGSGEPDLNPGQAGQVPDGLVQDLDEEVMYRFERTDEQRNLWRLRRAFRTARGVWQCMTVLENVVIPADGAPFRYDILTSNGAGKTTVTRRLVIDNPNARTAKPNRGLVTNELFDIDGNGTTNRADWSELSSGALIAGVHLRFCATDGRQLAGNVAYECDPASDVWSSRSMRLFNVGVTARNLMAWRGYVQGRAAP
jgi:type II secretory pathway pseudopilin PulG